VTAYVLDTSVISQLAPARASDNRTFAQWVHENQDRLFVPTVVVTEIVSGIEKLQRAGADVRAARVRSWLDQLLGVYGDRVLALDTPTAVLAGQISDAAKSIGRHPGIADVLIAATASMIGAGVLTRNVRHFEPLGVAAADPFLTPFEIRQPRIARPEGPQA
jgi:predicted nucleic acid-binding protein